MKKLIASLLSLALVVVTVSVMMGDEPAEPARNRNSFEIFHEDWEGGGWPGWTHMDRSGGPSEFHVSTYYAYDDGTAPNYSYWCGTFNYDADGGYGDGWVEYLELPDIDIPVGRNPPVLRFRYRICTSATAWVPHDQAWVEVKHLGEYRLLWDYWGASCSWTAQAPMLLEPFDNPLKLRFCFRSGIRISDEDGVFDSDGGAFHVDEIRVHEFGTAVDYFYDDVEDGVGLCSPVDVPPTGIVLHTIELPCRAYSDPTTTTQCEPGDTTSVPPNVFLSSVTPSIYVGGASECRLFVAAQYCMPPDADAGDEILIDASVDGGMTWSQVVYANSLGGVDSYECNEWGPYGLDGWELDYLLPATSLMVRMSMLTDDDGCGPGASGAGGVFVDDIWVVVDTLDPTAIPEGVSWGRIKSLYRE